ncbi:MAG: DUF2103 domain-containing protein [Aquificota bacterium]|nr:DUF2103 domain-containing protein [Aquificota bacterium]MDQ7081613.1 DUF2103 domain-containing protein [Aquificota bacterium]
MPGRRVGKLKVEHHLLEGLEDYLREMERWEVVRTIIPGRIVRQNRGRGATGLFLKYPTITGYKLIYKRGASVQEVFVVCSDKEAFKRLFRERFG